MECKYKSCLEQLKEDFYTRQREEERTKQQDEVRFRTMSDPRITYEQYSEMLKGAHLKPIKKDGFAELTEYKKKVTYKDYTD